MIRAACISPQWQQRLESAGLASVANLLTCPPDQLPLAGEWRLLTKPGLHGRQRWRWELPDAGGRSTVLFVKRYFGCPLKIQYDRIVRQGPRHSRAWWEYDQCRQLAGLHVRAPQPVAVAEQMCGPLERRGVVVLEGVGGDGFDRAWVAACQTHAPVTRGAARHDVTRRLARFVADLHQTGICHRDLYLCHIFGELDPQGGRPPEFTLIDLARTLRPVLRRMRWIIKDLAQLDSSARQIGASRADRLRFLHAYLGPQSAQESVVRYVRRIVRKSNWILRRIERQSRRP